MTERPLLILIDGHAVAYRAFHALPKETFTTSSGLPTNALYGFTLRMVEVMLERPNYIAVSLDKGLSGREAVFPEYKAQRDAMPDDLAVQIDWIESMVKAFNVPLLVLPDQEADDVIGTIARQAEEQGCRVLIITGDRDMLQLLSEHTSVQLPQHGRNEPDRIWKPADFSERFGGISYTQLIELKALMGDASDNIPGVAGIGEKGALNLLSVYPNLEAIYEHLEDIAKGPRNKLIEGREMAFLSRELATIKRDLPIQLDLAACKTHDFDAVKVLEIFDVVDFGDRISGRLKELIGEKPFQEAHEHWIKDSYWSPGYTVVTTPAQLEELVKTLENASIIAFDTETTDIDKMQAELVGISLSVDDRYGYYIPVGHIRPDAPTESGQLSLFADASAPDPEQLPLKTVMDALRPAMTNPAIPKVAHNAEYDFVILYRNGITVTPIEHDTMLLEWVASADSRRLGLKNLVREELNLNMKPIERLIGKGKKQITMNRVPIEDAAAYAAADAVATFKLLKPLQRALEEGQNPKARQLYETLEMPLIPVIAHMEMAGVLIDIEYLAQLSEELTGSLRGFEQQIFDVVGHEFNVNSPAQLNTVLFDELGLSPAGLRKTKQNNFSITASVLEELAETDGHEVLKLVLEYRSLNKLLSTYIDALPRLVNPRTGRVHTSFNQTGAVTGRLSSSNPNLQNIPIRTEEGRRVRHAFIAEPGNLLLSVDYSQIELRILAHYSHDESLRKAFAQNQDIHRATAAKVHGILPEQVTFEQRRFAKQVNFGLMYGMGAFRLTRDSDLTLPESEAFIKAYFDNFPGVREYLETTKDFARTYGYVETLFGRRRMFPELVGTGNKTDQQRAEREAINAPIQGTAADIIREAMINILRELEANFPQVRMLLQVHDELVFEVPENKVDVLQEMVVRHMEAAGANLIVPLVVDARRGTNWHDTE